MSFTPAEFLAMLKGAQHRQIDDQFINMKHAWYVARLFNGQSIKSAARELDRARLELDYTKEELKAMDDEKARQLEIANKGAMDWLNGMNSSSD